MKKNKILSSLVLFVFMLTIAMGAAVPQVGAAGSLSDISKHWAKSQIENLVGKGIISGYPDNTFKPEKTISRAEFMVMVNKAFSFSAATEISFKDVKAKDWFYQDVAKAKAAGYIAGFEDGTMRPNKEISRQEAAVMVAKAAKLDVSSTDVSKFKDAASIASWSRAAVAAMVKSSYITGYPDGTFKPTKSIKRAEAAAIISAVIGAAAPVTPPVVPPAANELSKLSKAGTYGPSTGLKTVNYDVTISASDVVLQNVKVEGNLTITADVGDGDVTLKNVTVTGTTTIKGGGPNSVDLDGCTLNKVIVNKANGQIRLVLSNGTTIVELICDSAVKIVGSGTVTKLVINRNGVIIEFSPGSYTIGNNLSAVISGKTVYGTVTSGGGTGGGGGGGSDNDADQPNAPNVTADDDNDEIIGITEAMEYKIDNGTWTRYDNDNPPDLSGDITVQVRYAATGTHPAGKIKTLYFTGLSKDSRLQRLTVSASTLTPAFASTRLTYTVAVSSTVASISLTPTVNQDHATVTVDGASVTSGQASQAIALTPGTPRAIDVVVTAEDTAYSTTYTVTVTRALPSQDSSLSNLVPSVGSLNPGFNSGTTSYTIALSNDTGTIIFTPTVSESHATVTVNGTPVTSGHPSPVINLPEGTPLAIPIVVTAQDTNYSTTYTVTVTRAAKSQISTLSNLVPSVGSLIPGFSSGTTGYSIAVANSVSSIRFTPTVSESHATVTVNSSAVTSGQQSQAINLPEDVPTAIPIVVTAQDTAYSTTYTVTVTRAAKSTDCTLSSLVTSTGSTNPAFSPGTTDYNMAVPYSVSSIQVTPTANDAFATITVNGSSVTSGQQSQAIALTANNTTIITILVTAQDTTYTRSYKINVTRGPANTVSVISSSVYHVSGGGTANETITGVPEGTSKATFLGNLTKGYSEQTWNSSDVSDPVAQGDTLVVTAEDGITTTTYTISVVVLPTGSWVHGVAVEGASSKVTITLNNLDTSATKAALWDSYTGTWQNITSGSYKALSGTNPKTVEFIQANIVMGNPNSLSTMQVRIYDASNTELCKFNFSGYASGSSGALQLVTP